MGAPTINWSVYNSLPPAEAQYQLDHVNESRAEAIFSSYIACLIIAIVAIVLRFISRRMSKTAIKADDWMIVAALIFAIGYIIPVILCILKYGGGRHAILSKDPVKFAQSVLAAEVFYPPAIASVKISTLFLFSRIFPARQFRILLYTVGLFVVTYSSIMVLGAIFQCIPIRGGWDTTVKAKCIEINLLWEILAGVNVLTDFILLLAPLPTLWGLQMQRGMKAQVMGLFCVGVFVCAVSIYRIPKLHGLSLHDASWSNADTTIWSVIEVCVAICCACAIVYRPIFSWLFRIRVSLAAPDNGSSRKTSKAMGWERDDRDIMKLQRVRTAEKGAAGAYREGWEDESESGVKGERWGRF